MEVSPEPLACVLGRLEAELAMVADQLRNVELALAQLTGRAPAIEADLSADLQQLDHALQSLLALKSFANGLAAQAAPDWLIDVGGTAARVNLSAIAARLGGTASSGTALANGEIELF